MLGAMLTDVAFARNGTYRKTAHERRIEICMAAVAGVHSMTFLRINALNIARAAIVSYNDHGEGKPLRLNLNWYVPIFDKTTQLIDRYEQAVIFLQGDAADAYRRLLACKRLPDLPILDLADVAEYEKQVASEPYNPDLWAKIGPPVSNENQAMDMSNNPAVPLTFQSGSRPLPPKLNISKIYENTKRR